MTKVVDAILERPKVVLAPEEIRSQKDYVYGHCVSVCTLSILMGMDHGLLYRDLKTLGTGALSHDVGKVAIDDPVWTKPGKLTEEEYELVKTHTTLGFEILRRRRELDLRAAHIAYQHYERFDRKGYPRGLQGDEILRFARIVSIADVFNALMSDRPYRDEWPVQKALNLIQEDAGSASTPTWLRHFCAGSSMAWDAMTSDRAYRKALSTEGALRRVQEAKGKQFDPLVVDAFVSAMHLSQGRPGDWEVAADADEG